MQFGTELRVERPEREVELCGLRVDVTERRTVHGKSVEWNHSVGWIDHSVLRHSSAGRGLAPQHGPRGVGAGRAKVAQVVSVTGK